MYQYPQGGAAYIANAAAFGDSSAFDDGRNLLDSTGMPTGGTSLLNGTGLMGEEQGLSTSGTRVGAPRMGVGTSLIGPGGLNAQGNILLDPSLQHLSAQHQQQHTLHSRKEYQGGCRLKCVSVGCRNGNRRHIDGPLTKQDIFIFAK